MAATLARAAQPVAAAVAPRPRRLGLGLFDLYLVRGVAGSFLLILLAVGAAMMLERALRLIHEMAASGADITYFLPLLAQLLPYYLDLAIPAAFMVALVLLVARLDDRLELEAMLASGLSLSRIAAPLVALGVVIGLAALLAGGWLEPHGRYGYRHLRVEALNTGRIARLEPRALYHPTDSLAVTFDSRRPDGSVGGIFVWQQFPDGGEAVLTSRAGRIGFAPQRGLFGIDLADGRYVRDRPGPASAPPYLVGFTTMAFRESLHPLEPGWRRGKDQKELTLPELLAAGRAGRSDIPARALEAEYLSRIARAAIVPLIPLLVLPLAFATKRGRRGLGILLGGALLAAFHHGMNLAKQLALGGVVEPRAAIIGMTALCAAVVLLLFWSGRHLPSHSPIAALLRPMAAALARLTPRTQALPSLSGRTIATYLAWQLGKWTLIALLAVVVLLQIVDLFERGEEFVARGFGLAEVSLYAGLRVAPIVQQALPIAALAGAMAVFAGLGRSLEMTAIRAAGISQWRILLMALPVPLLLALAAWGVAEYAAPQSQARFAAWWAQTEPAREAAPAEARWFRIGGEIVRAGAASAEGSRLRDVEIFRRDESGRLSERISAATATAGAGTWSLADVEVTRFGAGGSARVTSPNLSWPVRLDPAEVAAFFASVRLLSSAAAQRSRDALAPVSQGQALFATRLHRSLAEPLAPLIMLLLALPLAFAEPRKMAWPAIAYAGGGGLLYLAADGVLTVAAQVGSLPAPVGAWAAPVLAVLIAVTVLLYAER